MNASPALEASYRYCRQVARRSRSSFYPSFMLLSPPKRRAMHALYAFMRHTDDLGDSALEPAQRAAALARWRDHLGAALKGRFSQEPTDSDGPLLLPALADTVARCGIPPEHLEAVIDGQVMDLHPARYERFADLAVYCEKVASAVGLACLYVWGFRGPGALEPARKCGIAFQLTNILRDLNEDLGRGRLYLPLEDLRACDLAPEDLFALRCDDRFLRLVSLEADRAEQLYQEAAELAAWLEPDGRRIFGMMNDVYRRLLDKIRRSGDRVLHERIRLGRWTKLRVGLAWFLLPLARETPP